MTTLISLIGKSKVDSKTGYRTADYYFDQNFSRRVPFFGMGLLDYIKPDRLILAGTSGSMWDVFFDQHQADDESTLQLIEAVEQSNVSTQMLAAHEQRLTKKLGIPVQCLLIPYARDEIEQISILRDLANCTKFGEKLVLDVTHGFRHLPMLALVAARYLTHVRQVQVEELYYGALEMTDSDTGQTPVLRLGAMLKMLDWVEALSNYENNGDYTVFSTLLHDDGMDKNQAQLLSKAAYFERSNNPVQSRQTLTSVFESVKVHEGPLAQLFRDTLTQRLSWFRQGNRGDWELNLFDGYLKRKDYLRAVIYLYEAAISQATFEQKLDVNDFDHRKESYEILRAKEPEVEDLAHLRNAVAHGVKTPRKSIKALLDDSEKLEKKLQSLRKKLFA